MHGVSLRTYWSHAGSHTPQPIHLLVSCENSIGYNIANTFCCYQRIYVDWLCIAHALQSRHTCITVATTLSDIRAAHASCCVQMGTDQDARKRRAMRGQDGSDEEYPGSEEDDRLAGLWQNAQEDSDDAELSEEAKKQLQHAAVLRKQSVSILHICPFGGPSVLV